jgi:prepilin-type N-terminal cleavage/methylation domain-containing protein
VLKHLKNREDWSEKNVAQKGFTLIELLVVIAILGILAVVGVLAFGGLTDSANQAVDKTEEAEVKTAARAYTATTGDEATAIGDLSAYFDGTINCTYTFTAGVPAQDANSCT